MFNLLCRIFVKSNDYSNPQVRTKIGTVAGGLGIFFNILLCATKLIAGILSKSIAVMADSLNNLSDAAGSVITILGFNLANKKPDREHPFGHGRFEYISGLFVSFLILLMGFELLKESVVALIHPGQVKTDIVTIVILAFSILVKAYMFFYNKSAGKKINSKTMNATAVDSLSDCVSTAVVLAYAILQQCDVVRNLPFGLDGACGIFVACFILKNGYEALKDTIKPLLGTAPEKEFIDAIEQTVLAHKEISGIHDLVVHDYGPGRLMISLHAEIDGRTDMFVAHEVIDDIEAELTVKFNCHTIIHMDPVDLHNPEIQEIRQMIQKVVSEVHPKLSAHDIRVVPGKEHTNIVFDVVHDYECTMTNMQIYKAIWDAVIDIRPDYRCAITFDTPMV